jgi:DNA-binding transcriptional ArsR family regulator
MKQNSMKISLFELAGKQRLLGNQLGKAVFQKLQDKVGSHPEIAIFGISLKDIDATDASFPRESVISLVKVLCGEKGFYLEDFGTDDLLDNWNYAAKAKGQTVIVRKTGPRFVVIGPELPEGMSELLDYVMKEEVVTTSKVVKKFDISAPNASQKLRKLYQMGLVLGNKESAETGGLEFVYKAIKWSD